MVRSLELPVCGLHQLLHINFLLNLDFLLLFQHSYIMQLMFNKHVPQLIVLLQELCALTHCQLSWVFDCFCKIWILCEKSTCPSLQGGEFLIARIGG